MAPPSEAADLLALVQECTASWGIPLDPDVWPRFHLYLEELKTWNARINLTGLRTERDLVIKGFLESLAALLYLHGARTLADVGSGAGFPGLVLKLARPELTVTLVESRGKKAAFLDYMVSRLGLSGVEVLPVHLTPSLSRQWGPRFQAVTSRAVFPLPRLLELVSPLLLPGGRVLAYKGPRIPPEELQAARARLGPLGFSALRAETYQLPEVAREHYLVVVLKAAGATDK